MIDKRFVCDYSQYTYCGNECCSLSKYCKNFPVAHIPLKFDLKRKRNRVSMTPEETRAHEILYGFYNRLFATEERREQRKAYNKEYYQKNRVQILQSKRKPVSYKLPIVYSCEHECEKCPYEDCNLKLYTNRKEYMDMYTEKFHEEILRKKAEYRKTHRAFLKNSEKLRNYRKRGYIMHLCIVTNVSNKDFPGERGTYGYISIIKINGNQYMSWVSKDKEKSFRCKMKCENIVEDDKIIFYDINNNEYIFLIDE